MDHAIETGVSWGGKDLRYHVGNGSIVNYAASLYDDFDSR